MKKSDVRVGDKYQFLRMTNKAVKLSGTVVKIHDDPAQCVDMEVDGTGGLETAHIDDLIRGDNKQSKDLIGIGDHVKFLRMTNKAVEMKGVVVAKHGPGIPCVDIRVDGSGGLETAHVNDVVVLEAANITASAAAGTQSLTMVNGKPI
jgi:hypothetical protein